LIESWSRGSRRASDVRKLNLIFLKTRWGIVNMALTHIIGNLAHFLKYVIEFIKIQYSGGPFKGIWCNCWEIGNDIPPVSG
jgi:hypothetical protein